ALGATQPLHSATRLSAGYEGRMGGCSHRLRLVLSVQASCLLQLTERPRAAGEKKAYFGCTFGSPPGVPGGGMTLRRPPPGGVTSMPRSITAGGQMTPFDWASLSLKGSELPPPTVCGSPLTSGRPVAPCSGDAFSLGCASTTDAGAAPASAAMIRMVARTGNPSRICGACSSTPRGAKRSRGLAAESARARIDFVGAKSHCCPLERGDSIGSATGSGIVGTYDRSLDRSARLDPNRRGTTRGQQRNRGRNCGRRRGWYRSGPPAHGRAPRLSRPGGTAAARRTRVDDARKLGISDRSRLRLAAFGRPQSP